MPVYITPNTANYVCFKTTPFNSTFLISKRFILKLRCDDGVLFSLWVTTGSITAGSGREAPSTDASRLSLRSPLKLVISYFGGSTSIIPSA